MIRLTGRLLIRTKSLIRAVLRFYWHKAIRTIQNPLYMYFAVYVVLCHYIFVVEQAEEVVVCKLLHPSACFLGAVPVPYSMYMYRHPFETALLLTKKYMYMYYHTS